MTATITPLISDQYQTNESADVYTVEIPGLTWLLRGTKSTKDNRRIRDMVAKYADDPDVNYVHCLLSAMHLAWSGERSIRPKSYRAPVLDENDEPVIDPKTGGFKTKVHPEAGKKLRCTPETLTELHEPFLVKVMNGLVAHWEGRTEDEQETFRDESAEVL